MAVEKQYASDVELILSHRYDHGADLWTTPDKRLKKGAPFSTLESVMYLLELGMDPTEPVLKEAAELILSTRQEDGRFKLYPTGAPFTHAKPSMLRMCFATWGMRPISDCKKLSGIYWTHNRQMEGGAVINLVLAGGRKLTIRIRYQRLPPWMHFGSAAISIKNLRLTRL